MSMWKSVVLGTAYAISKSMYDNDGCSGNACRGGERHQEAGKRTWHYHRAEEDAWLEEVGSMTMFENFRSNSRVANQLIDRNENYVGKKPGHDYELVFVETFQRHGTRTGNLTKLTKKWKNMFEELQIGEKQADRSGSSTKPGEDLAEDSGKQSESSNKYESPYEPVTLDWLSEAHEKYSSRLGNGCLVEAGYEELYNIGNSWSQLFDSVDEILPHAQFFTTWKARTFASARGWLTGLLAGFNLASKDSMREILDLQVQFAAHQNAEDECRDPPLGAQLKSLFGISGFTEKRILKGSKQVVETQPEFGSSKMGNVQVESTAVADQLTGEEGEGSGEDAEVAEANQDVESISNAAKGEETEDGQPTALLSADTSISITEAQTSSGEPSEVTMDSSERAGQLLRVHEFTQSDGRQRKVALEEDNDRLRFFAPFKCEFHLAEEAFEDRVKASNEFNAILRKINRKLNLPNPESKNSAFIPLDTDHQMGSVSERQISTIQSAGSSDTGNPRLRGSSSRGAATLDSASDPISSSSPSMATPVPPEVRAVPSSQLGSSSFSERPLLAMDADSLLNLYKFGLNRSVLFPNGYRNFLRNEKKASVPHKKDLITDIFNDKEVLDMVVKIFENGGHRITNWWSAYPKLHPTAMKFLEGWEHSILRTKKPDPSSPEKPFTFNFVHAETVIPVSMFLGVRGADYKVSDNRIVGNSDGEPSTSTNLNQEEVSSHKTGRSGLYLDAKYFPAPNIYPDITILCPMACNLSIVVWRPKKGSRTKIESSDDVHQILLNGMEVAIPEKYENRLQDYFKERRTFLSSKVSMDYSSMLEL